MHNSENHTGLIVTQDRYALDPLSRLLFNGGKANLFLYEISRNHLTYGAIPHLGAEYLAAYLNTARFLPKVARLFGEQTVEKIEKSAITLISIMDIGVDRTVQLLEKVNRKHHHKIIVGGFGLQQQYGYENPELNETAKRLLSEFPEIAICPTEGEEVLGQALNDHAIKGSMNRVYARTTPFDLRKKDLEPYFQHLLKNGQPLLLGQTLLKTVEAGRGCGEDCSFCPTARCKIRQTPIEILKKEIEIRKIKPWEILFFVDQNLCSYPSNYLHELFDFINYHHIKWIGEGTISYKLKDEPLLRKMAQNCLTFLVGIEDPLHPTEGSNTKSRLELNTLARCLREVKLPIVYSLIIGTDNQQPGDGARLARTVLDLGITPSLHIATPRIGTRFWNSLNNEGRLTTKESAKRNMRFDAVHNAKNLTRRQILEEMAVFQEMVYTPDAITTRMANNLKQVGLQYTLGLLPTELAYATSTRLFNSIHSEIIKEVRQRVSVTKFNIPTTKPSTGKLLGQS